MQKYSQSHLSPLCSIIMLRQFWIRFRKLDLFHIDPNFFPENTRKLIPISQILKLGALPLGIKADKFLNIGLLNPYYLDARDLLNALAKEQGKIAHFYKIMPSDFVRVLTSHYGIDTKTLVHAEIEATLRQHLTSAPSI